MINKNIKSYKNKMIEEDIKKNINKILELISISFRVRKSEIRAKSYPENLFNYYVHVYINIINRKQLRELEEILDAIFKKENVGFILHDKNHKTL